jgi:hypothetical protein
MAGQRGLEPRSSVLETDTSPLNAFDPMCGIFVILTQATPQPLRSAGYSFTKTQR